MRFAALAAVLAVAACGTDNFPDPSQPDPNLYLSHVARIDHTISNKNRLYGRTGISKNIEKNYRDAFLNAATGNNLIRRNRGFTIDEGRGRHENLEDQRNTDRGGAEVRRL